MRQNFLLLLPVLLPIVAGILVLSIKSIRGNRKQMLGISLAVLLVNLAVCTAIAFQPDSRLTLWQLTDTVTIACLLYTSRCV